MRVANILTANRGKRSLHVPVKQLLELANNFQPAEGSEIPDMVDLQAEIMRDIMSLDPEAIIDTVPHRKTGQFVKNRKPLLKSYAQTAIPASFHESQQLILALRVNTLDDWNASVILEYTYLPTSNVN